MAAAVAMRCDPLKQDKKVARRGCKKDVKQSHRPFELGWTEVSIVSFTGPFEYLYYVYTILLLSIHKCSMS